MTDLRDITKADLRDAPRDAFLFCPLCDARYSATYGDYFMMVDDEPFYCENRESHGTGCHYRMSLATERREIIPA